MSAYKEQTNNFINNHTTLLQVDYTNYRNHQRWKYHMMYEIFSKRNNSFRLAGKLLQQYQLCYHLYRMTLGSRSSFAFSMAMAHVCLFASHVSKSSQH